MLFISPVQNNHSFQSEISQQLETLLNKVNSHTEMMKELEERRQKVNSMLLELKITAGQTRWQKHVSD